MQWPTQDLCFLIVAIVAIEKGSYNVKLMRHCSPSGKFTKFKALFPVVLTDFLQVAEIYRCVFSGGQLT